MSKQSDRLYDIFRCYFPDGDIRVYPGTAARFVVSIYLPKLCLSELVIKDLSSDTGYYDVNIDVKACIDDEDEALLEVVITLERPYPCTES